MRGGKRAVKRCNYERKIKSFFMRKSKTIYIFMRIKKFLDKFSSYRTGSYANDYGCVKACGGTISLYRCTGNNNAVAYGVSTSSEYGGTIYVYSYTISADKLINSQWFESDLFSVRPCLD